MGERRAHLEALLALTEDLGRAGTTGSVHDALVWFVLGRGFRRAAVASTTRDGAEATVGDRDGNLRRASWHGPAVAGLLSADRLRGPAVVRRVDPSSDPLLAALVPDGRGAVVVPLVAGDGRPGVLVAEPAGRRVRDADLAAVERAAHHAAWALARVRSLADAEWLATRDGLTGLVNRRVFDEALGWSVAAAQRRDDPLSLVLLDLDHFKAVNDGQGHLRGDEVLRAVGRALERACRSADVAARYGGDEFAVLLPGCPREAARTTAERLREAVTAEVTVARVTASAGVATLPDDAGDGEQLVAAADRALYRAKGTGRDRSAAAAIGDRAVERPPDRLLVLPS
ncbi:MAG: diguanylate cyclase [Acidimicrobiales bacterium]|nr:diguanylate cyclase [Acidimicrobiales bacterium]